VVSADRCFGCAGRQKNVSRSGHGGLFSHGSLTLAFCLIELIEHLLPFSFLTFFLNSLKISPSSSSM
jgi:hypothetical protein